MILQLKDMMVLILRRDGMIDMYAIKFYEKKQWRIRNLGI